ncbi:MAG: cytochrome b [Candidatus Puniceispirillum sp.]|nr:cytochrome b [Candidatus Puniceispirillum sp.]
MLKNTLEEYGWLAKVLHWVVGLAMIGIVIAGLIMTDMDQTNPVRGQIYMIHKSVGVTILALVLVRFLWRLANPVPALPGDMPAWQSLLAHLNIYLLYALMFSMALSGFLMSYSSYGVPFFGLMTFKGEGISPDLGKFFHTVHVFLPYVLYASFTAHIVGALYHHFVRKDNILRRML